LRLALGSLRTSTPTHEGVASFQTELSRHTCSFESAKIYRNSCQSYLIIERDRRTPYFLGVAVVVAPWKSLSEKGKEHELGNDCDVPKSILASFFLTGCVCGKEKLRIDYREVRRPYNGEKTTCRFLWTTQWCMKLESWEDDHLPQCKLVARAGVEFLSEHCYDGLLF